MTNTARTLLASLRSGPHPRQLRESAIPLCRALAAERRDRSVPLALLGLFLEALERALSVEPLSVERFESMLAPFHFRIERLLSCLDDSEALTAATEDLAATIRDVLWVRPS